MQASFLKSKGNLTNFTFSDVPNSLLITPCKDAVVQRRCTVAKPLPYHVETHNIWVTPELPMDDFTNASNNFPKLFPLHGLISLIRFAHFSVNFTEVLDFDIESVGLIQKVQGFLKPSTT